MRNVEEFASILKEWKKEEFSLENVGETVDRGIFVVEDCKVTAERAISLLAEPQPEKGWNISLFFDN